MAGRIRDEDIALVRERTPIDDVIGEHVQLRNAGGGNLKGLCPFHDEKSPSFNVTPARGLFHCLAGETKVLTKDGPRPIADLAGRTVTVMTEAGLWVDAPFYDFGIQPLWEIRLRRNGRHKSIFATDEHRWFLRKSAPGGGKGIERLTKDLRPGDRLAAAFPNLPSLVENPSYLYRDRCTRIGIGTNAIASQHRIGIDGNMSASYNLRLITEDARHEFFPLSEHRQRFEAGSKRDSRRHWVVESVTESDRVEPVYCAVVERTHTFVLEDNILTGNCFGCGVGGDVIRFVQNVEHLDFAEAVERLAARANIQLRYEEGGSAAPNRQHGQRARLKAANAAAAAFYAEQLSSPEAKVAREFLAGRGFDQAVAERFGCGYAPSGWDALTKHLLAKGFSPAELISAGLSKVSSGRSGLIDRFHRRLLWPIRDVGGEVVGFGARRLFDDDKIEAKYLNTPETPIYKKSELLYGVEVAKKEIARQHRAVIVEGYTDVMACHLAGVTTAVATCGTAFAGEHVKLVRRLLMDSDAFTGEVIFTFDGDAAGMKAAERAFADDQKFMSQTFVAIEASGMDPCDLRMKSGDTAVRDLVARRIPLVEFVLRATVARHDLDTAEGRVAALDKGIPIVAQIKDRALRDEYARRLAGLIGLDDPMQVVHRVRGQERAADRRGEGERPTQPAAEAKLDESVVRVEREVLKIALQIPAIAGPQFDTLAEDAFLSPAHRSLRAAIAAAGGAANAAGGPAWIEAIEQQLSEERLRSGVHGLAVEPLRTGTEAQERYADSMLARMHQIVTARQMATLKSRLQRINPLESAEEHARLFGQLISLESYHRALLERAIGDH